MVRFEKRFECYLSGRRQHVGDPLPVVWTEKSRDPAVDPPGDPEPAEVFDSVAGQGHSFFVPVDLEQGGRLHRDPDLARAERYVHGLTVQLHLWSMEKKKKDEHTHMILKYKILY